MDSVILQPEYWTHVAVAVACGAAIGLERQWRGKPAGIRTSSLICLGAASFVRLSIDVVGDGYSGSDATRVLGQVVVGVGFLGGGVIMNRGAEVVGLTSAAVIWILAGIGAAAGMGRADEAIALTLTTLLVLSGVEAAENWLPTLRAGPYAHKDAEPPVQPDSDWSGPLP